MLLKTCYPKNVSVKVYDLQSRYKKHEQQNNFATKTEQRLSQFFCGYLLLVVNLYFLANQIHKRQI